MVSALRWVLLYYLILRPVLFSIQHLLILQVSADPISVSE